MLQACVAKRKVPAEERPDDGPSEDRHRISANQFPHKRHARVFQYAHNVLSHQIEVFLAHFRHLIFHFARIVFDDEGVLLFLWFLVELALRLDAIEFVQQFVVRGTGEANRGRGRGKSQI